MGLQKKAHSPYAIAPEARGQNKMLPHSETIFLKNIISI